MRPGLRRLAVFAPSVMARPALLRRSVTVTRGLPAALVRLVTRPVTVSLAPGASATLGGALIERSFADGVAASVVPADSATSAPHDDRHASDLARRSDNFSPSSD